LDSDWRSSLSFFVDILIGGLGVWLFLDDFSLVSCLVFCAGNLGTLGLFRIPGRRGLTVHTHPWELPVALTFTAGAFLWPYLVAGTNETRLVALSCFIALTASRTLIAIGSVQARAEGGGRRRSLFGRDRVGQRGKDTSARKPLD
jgi:hypothetical protein